MKKTKHQLVFLLFLASGLIMQSCGRDSVTLESLLDEMVDREQLARLPEIPYTLKQFSSYDRGAVAPGRPGWFANSDRTMFIREEMNQGRKEYVMADTEGPGAIVRVWMTFAGENSGNGILRFYFDGDTIPEIEGTAFDVISGGQLVGEPLGSSVSDLSPYENRGHNLYLPLPYQKHCKITYESNNITNYGNKGNTGESVYYNINYRTYPEGTAVSSFSLERLKVASSKVEQVREILLKRETGLEKLNLSVNEIGGTIKPGKEWTAGFEGPSAIRYIRLQLDAENLEQALRSTVLKMEFDGEQGIWCPVGDFFGTGYQIRPLNTWYARVDENGTMEAYWVMPFEKTATLSIMNTGGQEVEVAGQAGLSAWKWDDRSMHFRSSWHQFTNIFTREGMTAESEGSPFDINYVDLSGKGVYVGDGLVLFNTSYIWWGEGDEKIYVDGEDFPSHFGTGTEDYYGYAWGGRSKRFSNHPFIAQPDESGNAAPGYVVNLRYRILDALPFNESLEVDMELWHWHATWINYAPATYYYMRPGGSTNIVPDTEGARAKVALKSTDIIPNRLKNGKIEAEHMAFRNSCGNRKGSMGITPFGDVPLSGNLRVVWQDGQPGDTIYFNFVSEMEGMFGLQADFCNGPAFGRFKALLNGRELSSGILLHSSSPSMRTVKLGQAMIRMGENTLAFVVMPGQGKRHLFGMDVLLLKQE